MHAKQEIREFPTSRRARITPEQAGLNTYGSRRVPGLRREEVAVLAGVSVPYYTRLERGDLGGASESVLEALRPCAPARRPPSVPTCSTSPAPRHPTTARPRRRQSQRRIRPEIQWTLDAITGAAAYVSDERLDILATNALGRALFSEMYAGPARPRQQRPLRLPRPAGRDLLHRLGPRRPRHRRDPTHSGRPRPARPDPLRPSSGSSRRRVRLSGRTGPRTTFESTPAASSATSTPWSASSP